MTIKAQYPDALDEIYTRLGDHQLIWTIARSLGMALQGMPNRNEYALILVGSKLLVSK
jgi:hypothetical protein